MAVAVRRPTQNGKEPFDLGKLSGERFELTRDCFALLLELADLVAGLDKEWPERVGKLRFIVLDESGHFGNDLLRALGDEDAELAQNSPHGVDASSAGRQPSGAESMKGCEGVLGDGLDGNRKNFFVSMRLEQSLGVRPVVFACHAYRALRGERAGG
jgi:hypothetical protein